MADMKKVYDDLIIINLYTLNCLTMYSCTVRAIITRVLYILNPLLKVKNVFPRFFFRKFCLLFMDSIQQRFVIKSGLYWHASGISILAKNLINFNIPQSRNSKIELIFMHLATIQSKQERCQVFAVSDIFPQT